MKSQYRFILLISGNAITFITRVVLPFFNVFTSNGIQLNTPDAYVMLRAADMWPFLPSWDWFKSYPIGAPSNWLGIWPVMCGFISKLSHIDPAIILAIMPVILFFLTVIAFYITARLIFNRDIAAIATFLLCILPGTFQDHTSLGAGDYHCWEIFLVMAIIMSTVLAYKKRSLLAISGAISVFIIYWYSWAGAPLILGIILLTLVVVLHFRMKNLLLSALVLAAVGSAIVMAIIVKSSLDMALQMIMPNSLEATSEEQPLFFMGGQADNISYLMEMGLLYFVALAGLGWIAYRAWKKRQTLDIFIVVWSVVMLVLMISHRRFEYYFALNVALLSGFLLWQAWQLVKVEYRRYFLVLVGIGCCLPLIGQGVFMGTGGSNFMSVNWQNVTSYLHEQASDADYYADFPPPFGVFSQWGYGYWLTTASHVAVYEDGGYLVGDSLRQSDHLLVSPPYDTVQWFKQNHYRYVVISKDMLHMVGLERATDCMTTTFMYQAYNNGLLPLAYQSGDVKVLEVR